MELLPRAETGELHRDLGRPTGRELAGHIGDTDRFAHIQHERLAVGTDRAGLDHELYGLFHGHEVAGHIRVSHRQRLTRVELGAKGRENRTATAEHIAEPNAEVRTRLRSA